MPSSHNSRPPRPLSAQPPTSRFPPRSAGAPPYAPSSSTSIILMPIKMRIPNSHHLFPSPTRRPLTTRPPPNRPRLPHSCTTTHHTTNHPANPIAPYPDNPDRRLAPANRGASVPASVGVTLGYARHPPGGGSASHRPFMHAISTGDLGQRLRAGVDLCVLPSSIYLLLPLAPLPPGWLG